MSERSEQLRPSQFRTDGSMSLVRLPDDGSLNFVTETIVSLRFARGGVEVVTRTLDGTRRTHLLNGRRKYEVTVT